MATKGHPYSSKNAAKSCRFARALYDPPLRPIFKGTTNIQGLICRNKDTKNDTRKRDCSIVSIGNLR